MSEKKAIQTSLLYFHVGELRELATRLSLVEKGDKKSLILRIVHFLETGERLSVPKFPAASRAKRGVAYPLEREGLMMKGAYKNDLKTRLFFKQLIGPHFHFTAYGIDWLNAQWLEGKPPTYGEFVEMWQAEHEQRKKEPAPPKKEWAYINFVQGYVVKAPHANREEVNRAWQAERERHKAKVMEVIASQ